MSDQTVSEMAAEGLLKGRKHFSQKCYSFCRCFKTWQDRPYVCAASC